MVEQGKIIEPQLSTNLPFKLIESYEHSVVWHLVAQTGQSAVKIDHSSPLTTLQSTQKSLAVTVS